MIKLYIGISLDGFIADRDGSVTWLEEAGAGITEISTEYEMFLRTVDAILMGRKTYDQVLGFGPWPYADKLSFVATHSPLTDNPNNMISVAGAGPTILTTMRQHTSGNIWLVGGAELVAEFRRHSLIDEYLISIAPILLGSGIPLFSTDLPREDLELVHARQLDGGFVSTVYRQK